MKLVTRTDETVQNIPTLDFPNINEIGRHVLLCIRRFWQAFPDPIALSELKTNPPDDTVRKQILAWLVSQKIIVNPDDRFVLTLAGRESIRKALSANRCLAEFFPKGECILDKHNPSELMIMILKTHFDGFLDRQAKTN